jgi:cytochrome b
MAAATSEKTPAAARPTRRMIDAPVRAFHWLFALSFAGAWLTAESERWRALHVALGYAFGALLLFRLVYGLIGPRHARLTLLWRRATGLLDWLRQAWAGRIDGLRAANLGMGVAMLTLMMIAAPLVLSGYAVHIDWLGLDRVTEELHEFCANLAMALVALHLTLIALLSVLRRRNLAAPMCSGRAPGPGPDLVKANRAWLAGLLLLAYSTFIGWQTLQPSDPGARPQARGEHRHAHQDHDD